MSELKYIEIIGDDNFGRVIFWVIIKSLLLICVFNYFQIKYELIIWVSFVAVLVHTYFNSKKRVIFYENEVHIYKRNWLTFGTYKKVIPKNKVQSISCNYGFFNNYLSSILIHYNYFFYTRISFYSENNDGEPLFMNCRINSSSRFEMKIPFEVDVKNSSKFKEVSYLILTELRNLGYVTK